MGGQNGDGMPARCSMASIHLHFYPSSLHPSPPPTIPSFIPPFQHSDEGDSSSHGLCCQENKVCHCSSEADGTPLRSSCGPDATKCIMEVACLKKGSVYGTAKPPVNESGCAVGEGGIATMKVLQADVRCAELLLEWVFERVDHYRGSLFNQFELKIPQQHDTVH